MAGNVGTPGVSVASRLLAVLDCFSPANKELTLTEIARSTGLPISTTRRLIVELAEWGGLERLVDNRYRVGIHLWEIGILAPQQRGLREAALPFMHDLCKATGETVQLVVLDGKEALCVEKIAGSGAVPTKSEVGGRLPLHATAVGKCILAHSPLQLFLDLIDSGVERNTPYTSTQPGRLSRELKAIRSDGVAYSREEMTVGAVSVAAPLLAPGGILRGALGIVVHSSGRLDHLAPAVKTAALSISRDCA